MNDRASEVIKHGDPDAIVRMALGARFAAEEGRFCECAEPSLHGFDLMCGNCLLENQGQIEKRTRQINELHEFVPGRGDAQKRLGMCEICSMWEHDPRHIEPSAES
jgi:hypothetical protein